MNGTKGGVCLGMIDVRHTKSKYGHVHKVLKSSKAGTKKQVKQVRDVAAAHVGAVFNSAASGRYLVSSDQGTRHTEMQQ